MLVYLYSYYFILNFVFTLTLFLSYLSRKIEAVHLTVSKKDFRSALLEVDLIIKITGSRVRELNLLKVAILIGLSRAPEAFNLTNAMVRMHVHSFFFLLSL